MPFLIRQIKYILFSERFTGNNLSFVYVHNINRFDFIYIP